MLSDKGFGELTRCLRGRGLLWGGCMVSLRPIVFSAFSFSNTSASSDARVLAYSFSPPVSTVEVARLEHLALMAPRLS